MNFIEKINIFCKLAGVFVSRKRIPLIISWNITYRCNLQCSYCGWWKNNTEELTTDQIIYLIEDFVSMGTKFISFGGGEPLLREDLGEIIDFCKRKKIYISINTNGTLVKEKMNKIKKADTIKLSLDGPAYINDLVRGKGGYDNVVEAIAECRKKGLKVDITTVISRYNVGHIPEILRMAEKHNTGIYFQPADNTHFYSCKENISSWLPDKKDYKKAITLLINDKAKGNKFINNTLAGLQHLYYWPQAKKVACFMSFILCNVDPDGRIFICDSFPNYRKFSKTIDFNLKKTFDNLSLPYSCKQCWCASLADFNSLAVLKPNIALNMWRRL
jgi:MoaA/NifB/PqqE/SkfB family radical SAM enzyme